MRQRVWLATAALALLSGCGGSGGGVNSTPAPPTPTPSPSPTPTGSIHDLSRDESFQADAASSAISFNLTSSTTITGTTSSEALTVSYDAGSKSYTVSAGGRSDTFSPADIAISDGGQVQYAKSSGTQRDYLTLVTVPYTSSTSTHYVGLGYWQQNALDSGTQNTSFDTFTYGYQSPASAIPRAGRASFGVDVFGLAATPGHEPREFQGHGTFDTDFLSGVFSTQTYLNETGLISGDGVSGGGIELTGAGHLTSGNGFSGNVLYGGWDGSLAGTIAGHFYGPAAQELGASFNASNSDGSTVTGSMTGSLDPSNPAVNETLTNLVTPQLFYTQEALLSITDIPGGTNDVRTTTMVSQLNDQTSGNLTYGPGRSDLVGGTWTTTAQVASPDPNFVSYKKSFNGQEAQLDLYKPGPGNTELALTYASFGRWRSTQPQGGANTELDQVYFVYGLETPTGLLGGRTGSGHYQGIVYGAGADQTGATRYDIGGTSTFDIDFSNQKYTGALAMTGAKTDGSGSLDFGAYGFSGKLSSGTPMTADILQGTDIAGQITPRFFGPDGEEIGAPFTLAIGAGKPGAGTQIAGVAVAKRQ